VFGVMGGRRRSDGSVTGPLAEVLLALPEIGFSAPPGGVTCRVGKGDGVSQLQSISRRRPTGHPVGRQ